jgi:ABC-type molybdate transport system ATPase subunit
MIDLALRHRFRDFALDVAFASEGPVLGVFGASGSGKTTLLHAIAGLRNVQRHGRFPSLSRSNQSKLQPKPAVLCVRSEQLGYS